MLKKKSLFLIVPLILSIAFFSSCKQSPQKFLGNMFAVKPPPDDAVMVAVLPIQNATFHPVRITGHKSVISRFLDEFLKRSLKFNYSEDDVAYVQKSLQLILTQRLYNSGYPVLNPGEIYGIFAELGLDADDRELDIEDITVSIPADWLLLVTITMWEADKFDRKGEGEFSYQAVVVDTRRKEAIWTKTEEGVRFKAPSKTLPYNRQGGEMLSVLAKRILREFPKAEKIMDYLSRVESVGPSAER